MIITVKENSEEKDIQDLLGYISSMGFSPRVVQGENKKIIELIGSGKADAEDFAKFACVEKVHRIQKSYKRISLEGDRTHHKIKVRDLTIGGEKLVVMIGPCAIENFEQTDKTAALVASYPVNDNIEGYVLRGGAFKPRTSPYAFEGLKEDGLKILREVGDKYNLPVITEVMAVADIETVHKYTDIHQVGTRNFQNFSLLDALGEVDKPVLLKRGMSGTLEEFLLAAERIVSRGNSDVILCLRGIRTFNDAFRNDVDSVDVIRLKQLTNLPVVFDPSHSTGNREAIIPAAMGAVTMGIDGLLIDLHVNPEQALVDGAQALWPAQGEALVKSLDIVKEAQLKAKKEFISAQEAKKIAEKK